MSASPLRISCLTWNIGHPPEFAVSNPIQALFTDTPDICAITFQEFQVPIDLGDNETPPKLESLKSAVSQSVPTQYTVTYARGEGGVAMFLCFLRDSKFRLAIRDDIAAKHSIDGVTRGKASIAVRVSAELNGLEKTFYIIGNHLECYDEKYDTRNAEWKQVLELVKDRSDYIIMMGDLNYRVELERAKVLDLIAKGDYQALLRCDQLNRAKRENPEFAVFAEAPITFPPTYKFDENSDVYDTSSKQRIPSYTDRVLVASITETNAKITNYAPYHDLLSDHRPVSAAIQVNFQ